MNLRGGGPCRSVIDSIIPYTVPVRLDVSLFEHVSGVPFQCRL
jgi:hypothetical protein